MGEDASHAGLGFGGPGLGADDLEAYQRRKRAEFDNMMGRGGNSRRPQPYGFGANKTRKDDPHGYLDPCVSLVCLDMRVIVCVCKCLLV